MAEPKKDPSKSGKTVPGLRIVAKREGFRRAGRQFGATPTDIPLSQLTKESIESLKGEPMLVVTDVEIEAGE